MQQHHIAMLGTGLIGDFYTMALHGAALARPRAGRLFRSEERGEAFCDAGTSRVDDGHESRHRAPRGRRGRRRRAQLPARGGNRSRGAGRQGGAVHQAARSERGRGRPDAGRWSSRRASSAATSRTCATRPRRPRRSRPSGRHDRRGHMGALREAHPGPHSAWFWDGRLTGGGAIVDLGCHCIEIIRNYGQGQPTARGAVPRGHARASHR